MALANDTEALVWRRTGLTWWMAGCCTTFVFVSLATLTAGIGMAFYAGLLVAATFLLVRTLTSRVVITTENLLIRSPFRTKRLSWDSIVEARSVAGNGLVPIFGILEVTTHDGKLRVEGLGSWRLGRQDHELEVTSVVDAINERARASAPGSPDGT